MARVVLITPYFWPDIAANVPLMTSLCEDLKKYGHQVTVLTSYPGKGIDYDNQYRFRKTRSTPEYFAGARVWRFSNFFVGRLGSFSKLMEYLIFTFWVILTSIILSRRTDVFFVYSNPPLLGWPLYIATRLGRSRIIYNLQDLFPDSAIDNGQIKNHFVIKLLKLMEKRNYACASVVSVISEAFAQHVKAVSPNTSVALVPNWIDLEIIRPIPKEENLFLQKIRLSHKFIVLYAGNLGFAQNLELVLKAAKLLQINQEIIFVIVGEGQQKQYLKAKIQEDGLNNVNIFPFQPEELVAHVYSACDIGLVTMKPETGLSSVPSKAWSIMGCERPVVASIDKSSDLASIIEQSQSGLVVRPDDAKLLVDAILQLYANTAFRYDLGKNGRRYVENTISRKVITRMYCELIDSLV